MCTVHEKHESHEKKSRKRSRASVALVHEFCAGSQVPALIFIHKSVQECYFDMDAGMADSDVGRNKAIQARSARWRFRRVREVFAENTGSRCRSNRLIPAYFEICIKMRVPAWEPRRRRSSRQPLLRCSTSATAPASPKAPTVGALDRCSRRDSTSPIRGVVPPASMQSSCIHASRSFARLKASEYFRVFRAFRGRNDFSNRLAA
jgi:hypothetical protein